MNDFGKLRSIQDEELPMILEWRNSADVRKNMYTQHKITLEEHLAWWERIRSCQKSTYLMYEYNGEALGVVGFTQIDTKNKNASWAFYASPNAPQGTGSKMEFLALDYAFDKLKLFKLYCEVLSYNSAVIKLHLKFGFIEEGILRKHYFYQNNYVDIHCLAIFIDDWKDMREQMCNKLKRLAMRHQ